jgi:hypothetical protein
VAVETGTTDGYLPESLAVFLVEEYFGIRDGVYGRIAAGADTRPARDGGRSERLVALCKPLWEARSGRMPTVKPVIDTTLATPFDVDRMMRRFDVESARWRSLEPGASVTMEWPDGLTGRRSGPANRRSPERRHGRRTRTAASH